MSPIISHTTDLYLLGGHDLEMLTLRTLLEESGIACVDKNLSWGAKAGAYADEIGKALAGKRTPVAVELADDLAPDISRQVVWIDHHNERAGAEKPGSLRQVFDRLGLPEESWSRHYALVAANDTGHVQGMLALGAGMEEMRAIRAADRAAQGATAEEEQQAQVAVAQREQTPFDLDIVRLPHDRASIVADLLEPALGGNGASNLLVIGKGEWNFYGQGEVVSALYQENGGWCGGALPERGFWGQIRDEALENALLASLKDKLRAHRADAASGLPEKT